MQLEDADEVVAYVACPRLAYNQPGVAYACVRILDEDDATNVTMQLACTMKFLVKDCDPNTGEADDDEGYEDEYPVSRARVSFSPLFTTRCFVVRNFA